MTDSKEEVTQFYRCLSCHKAIEMTEHLKAGEPSCSCGGRRFSPTVITKWEATRYLVSHPSVLFSTLKARLVTR